MAANEPPSAVADGVLTNLLLVRLGGGVADDAAMIELLAGIGLPIAELPPDEQVRAARLMDAVLGAFSMEELVGIAEGAPLEELRGAAPVVVRLLDVVPGELRALIPRPVAEQLPTLLAPLVVQLGRVAARLLVDSRAPDLPAAASQSQSPATMETMPLPRTPGQLEAEARSA